MTIAKTIFQQLGGSRFVIMTGAKNFVDTGDGLRFTIGRNGSKANMVKITLNGDDTYKMQFIKNGKNINPYMLMVKYYEQGMTNEQIEKKVQEATRRAEPTMLKEYDGIYCDQLQDLFTEYTKLYTRL